MLNYDHDPFQNPEDFTLYVESIQHKELWVILSDLLILEGPEAFHDLIGESCDSASYKRVLNKVVDYIFEGREVSKTQLAKELGVSPSFVRESLLHSAERIKENASRRYNLI